MAEANQKQPVNTTLLNSDIASLSKMDAIEIEQLIKEAKSTGKSISDVLLSKSLSTNLLKVLRELKPIEPMPKSLYISKDIVEMDDILTQQILSTYSKSVNPLIISNKTQLSSSTKK
jgi:hypothetical protein